MAQISQFAKKGKTFIQDTLGLEVLKTIESDEKSAAFRLQCFPSKILRALTNAEVLAEVEDSGTPRKITHTAKLTSGGTLVYFADGRDDEGKALCTVQLKAKKTRAAKTEVVKVKAKVKSGKKVA